MEPTPLAPASVIRLFASSPDDVQKEVAQLASVVQELNTVLRAFVRDKRVVVELVHWKTHVHADMGPAQDVVDRQLGGYDIYLGIMWSRFGTPTARAGSGTEQEFREAYAGWEQRRSPAHILFYFCDAAIPGGLLVDDAEQLVSVAKFRDELRHKGLIKSYATHEAFADTVRADLVLVLSELLRASERPTTVAAPAAKFVPEGDLAVVRKRIEAIGREYDDLRNTMSSGPERTRRLEVVASQMRTMAQSTYLLLPELVGSTSAGRRLVAVAALQALPDPEYLPWLVERVYSEKPFLGYHAAVALLAAARTLPDRDIDAIDQAVKQAIAGAKRLRPDTDRAVTLANAEDEVRRRRSRLASR